MSRAIPVVAAGILYDPQHLGVAIPLDAPAWFTWLELPQTRSFAYPLFDARQGYIIGYMTVRKERRQRGGSYWRVYRRSQGRLRSIYLGSAQQVTRARLVAIVRMLLAEHAQCTEAEVRMTPHH